MTSIAWEQLGAVSPLDLKEARLAAHYAVQFVGRVAQSYLEKRSDDSQMSLEWDVQRGVFLSDAIPSADGEIRVSLELKSLDLIFFSSALEPLTKVVLDGKTLAEAEALLHKELSSKRFDPTKLVAAMPYELPEHPLAGGARFDVASIGGKLEELGRYFSNSLIVIRSELEREDSPPLIRVWPHHFDLGALILLDQGGGEEARSVGVGMSPGDGSYPQPYFYVTPWPYPSKETLLSLAAGHWHTEGWIGAVLTGEKLSKVASAPRQLENAAGYLAGAITASKAALG